MKNQEVQNAEEWVKTGQQHLQDNLYEEALVAFRCALAIDRNLTKAWCGQAQAKLRLQYYEDAINNYNEVLESNCRSCPGGWCSRGEAKQAMGRYEEAIDDFDEAIKIKSNNPEALLNKSCSLIFLQKYEDALSVCDCAIKIKPDYAEAYLNQGIAFHSLGNYAAALKSYDQAIRFNEKLPKLWYNRGCTLANLKNYQDAALSYTKAIELDQDQYWLAWIELGQVTVSLKGYKAAQDIWLQGIQKLLPYPNPLPCF